MKLTHSPEAAMAAAYASGGYTMDQIAAYFGVHYSSVSRAVTAQNQASPR
jgi:transposase